MLFEEAASDAGAAPEDGEKEADEGHATRTETPRQVARLERELEATREYLQSIIEEQEAMNEELRSANEEIQSSNEELQSTNEELETAKEELQSSNEELTTLNEELQNRNERAGGGQQRSRQPAGLGRPADPDARQPICASGASTRARKSALNLIPSRCGTFDQRPEADLRSEGPRSADRRRGRESGGAGDRGERSERAGYTLRVRPYKTADNKIEGAVLVLIDITHLRKQ